MQIPPKKTEEQIQIERSILKGGFDSAFWSVLRQAIESERDACYQILPTINTIEDLKRVQGQILAFERVLGLEAPYKKAR